MIGLSYKHEEYLYVSKMQLELLCGHFCHGSACIKHMHVYKYAQVNVHGHKCITVYVYACETEGPYPILVVLYSTLRMGLQDSGFFPSLGCFPKIEQTEVTLVCSSLLLHPVSSVILGFFPPRSSIVKCCAEEYAAK